MCKRNSKQTALTRSSSMVSARSSPSTTSTTSTPGSSPAPSETPSGRKRIRSAEELTVDDSDVGMVTPTRPKRQKGLSTRERALAFKATFPAGLSDEDILGTFNPFLIFFKINFFKKQQ